MTKTKADRTLSGEEEESSVSLPLDQHLYISLSVPFLLWDVGCDEGGHRHQAESQDEAQREVDEGGATQQHSQVKHRDQLQHLPALLRALARQEPGTGRRTKNSSLSWGCSRLPSVWTDNRI